MKLSPEFNNKYPQVSQFTQAQQSNEDVSTATNKLAKQPALPTVSPNAAFSTFLNFMFQQLMALILSSWNVQTPPPPMPPPMPPPEDDTPIPPMPPPPMPRPEECEGPKCGNELPPMPPPSDDSSSAGFALPSGKDLASNPDPRLNW